MDDYDHDKLDEIILALTYLTPEDPKRNRAWRTFPWPAIDRLEEKGMIEGKSKWTVVLSEAGRAEAARLFKKHFGKPEE